MNSAHSLLLGESAADMGWSQSRIPVGGVTTRTPTSHVGLADVQMQRLTTRGYTTKEAEFHGSSKMFDVAWPNEQ